MTNHDGPSRIAALRKNHGLGDESEVAVWSTFGQSATIKEAPSGGRTIHLIATTDDIDLDGDVVQPQGADLTYWERGGLKVFADHSYGIFDVAAHARRDSLKMFPDERAPRGWKFSAGLLKDSPAANAIAALVRETGMIGASIGFRTIASRPGDIKDMRGDEVPERVITKWLWLETSLTAMPCNVNCQGVLIDGPSKMLNELDRLVTKGAVTKEAAAMLGLPVGAMPVTVVKVAENEKPKKRVLLVVRRKS